jgi:hypothetical protein
MLFPSRNIRSICLRLLSRWSLPNVNRIIKKRSSQRYELMGRPYFSRMPVNAISVSIRRKPSVSYDPFFDGWPVPYGHWQSAYAYENHERSCGDVYEVEMYVSFVHFCGPHAFADGPRHLKIFSIKDYGSPYPSPVKGTAKLGKKRLPANRIIENSTDRSRQNSPRLSGGASYTNPADPLDRRP